MVLFFKTSYYPNDGAKKVNYCTQKVSMILRKVFKSSYTNIYGFKHLSKKRQNQFAQYKFFAEVFLNYLTLYTPIQQNTRKFSLKFAVALLFSAIFIYH